MAYHWAAVHRNIDYGFVPLESFFEEGDPDYTNAFNRAVACLEATTPYQNGGGTIMLAGKNYTISSTIVIQSSISIVGVGCDSGSCISLASGSDCNMFEIGKRDSSDPISVNLNGFRMQMLGTQADGYSHIVFYNYIRHSYFYNLFLAECTGPNVEFKTDPLGTPGRNNYWYGCAFEYGHDYAWKGTHDYNLNFINCYFGFGRTACYGLYISMSATNLHINNCWILPDAVSSGIYVAGCYYGTINGNHINGGTGGIAGSAGIHLSNCHHFELGGNIIIGDHPYAIRLSGASTENIRIHDNIMLGYTTQPFYFDDKTKAVCKNNTFKSSALQENKGNATIQAGDSYVIVTHNVFTTPDCVIATPRGDEKVWVSDIGATTFRINRAEPDSSGGDDLICSWMAGINTY